jgi:hypothetical protein
MPENRDRFLLLVIAFAAGVMVGANWPEIKKQLGPMVKLAGGKLDEVYSYLAEFLAERKERTEDFVAERRHRKQSAPKSSAAEEAFLAGLAQVMGNTAKKTKTVAKRKPAPRKPARKKQATAGSAPAATRLGSA